jgi:hypothetical protein
LHEQTMDWVGPQSKSQDVDPTSRPSDFALVCLSPRDAVTISKTFHDATTLIDISTSLPRSPDEPAYLRPAPPYVRSHVHCMFLDLS